MIFTRIILRISVTWAMFFPAWVTVSDSFAASAVENRLAAELLVMKGDLRRLDEFNTLSLIKKGLKDRLLGSSASLSLLIRAARDNNASLPIPPKNSVTSLQRALLGENFKEAKFWVSKLLRVFPLKTKGILPPNNSNETLMRTKALHNEFCSGCHASDTDVQYNLNIERPAWNLFQMAQEVEQDEFAARLLIGVKGDSLTAMENPLSYTEISGLIEFYRSRNYMDEMLVN